MSTKNELIQVDILTDASGDFTYDTGPVNGTIDWYRYVPGDLSANWDLTIAGKRSGVSIVANTTMAATAAQLAPRQPTSDAAGAASLYASGGEPVEDRIAVADEQLTVTVANGGATKSGTLFICVRGP